MPTATVRLFLPQIRIIRAVGRMTMDAICLVGDLALFTLDVAGWLMYRRPRLSVFLQCCYEISVRSIPVVVITGMFIGMVLAVQTFQQLQMMKLETMIGSVINVSLLRELGPTLAATMLAGRVGSAMAAELGTMRVTEQIDALRLLGANPLHYLVVPRFLACFLLIPLLTVFADAAGIVGGWFFSTQAMGLPSQHYWLHTENVVSATDMLSGIFKSLFFGASISLVSCHRGFHCDAGAEGVGKAATEAFVYSFVSILALDFFIGVFLTTFDGVWRSFVQTVLR